MYRDGLHSDWCTPDDCALAVLQQSSPPIRQLSFEGRTHTSQFSGYQRPILSSSCTCELIIARQTSNDSLVAYYSLSGDWQPSMWGDKSSNDVRCSAKNITLQHETIVTIETNSYISSFLCSACGAILRLHGMFTVNEQW